MTKAMKIDFVSDVSCPWCIIGLGGLEEALARVGDLVEATIAIELSWRATKPAWSMATT